MEVRWVNYVEQYDASSVGRASLMNRLLPFRVWCWWDWIWSGPGRWSITQWVIWDGKPPCRISRLWRRP